MTLIDYVKKRKYFIFLILLCSVIHAIVLLLYGNETEPVWYATVLYLVLLTIIGFFDFCIMKKRYQALRAYDVNTDMVLPEQDDQADKVNGQLYRIISELRDCLWEQESNYRTREKDTSDFYTMWVHQIKTPIAALQVLLQTDPKDISMLRGELFKIERYVDVVLNYQRMQDLNSDLVLKHYSLEGICKQAVKKYAPLFIRNKLSVRLDNLDTVVLTDEKWLVFVVEQIISNAVKYTQKGGIQIYSKSSVENERRVTTLTVEDTGIGICPEDLPRIYDRAFTGYNGRDDKKASGLGLYLCKTILNKIGHDISIVSNPNQGTAVTITFYEDGTFSGNLTKM